MRAGQTVNGLAAASRKLCSCRRDVAAGDLAALRHGHEECPNVDSFGGQRWPSKVAQPFPDGDRTR